MMGEGVMDYEISYDHRLKVIIARINGIVDNKTIQDIISELKEQSVKWECQKFLCDLRTAALSDKVFDIYDIPRISDQFGIPHIARRALLVEKVTENLRFLETAAVNIGHATKLFTNLDEAVVWLLEK